MKKANAVAIGSRAVRFLAIAAATLFAAQPRPADAVTYTWLSATLGGLWSSSANWNPSTGTPIAGDIAVLDTVSGTSIRTVTYDTAATGTFSTLTLNQTASGTNTLEVQRNLTVTNTITLGASNGGVARLLLSSSSGTTSTNTTTTANVVINSGGMLSLNAFNPSGTSSVGFGNLTGNVTLQGGQLVVENVQKAGSTTSANSTVNGSLTMTSGTLLISNTAVADRRLTFSQVNVTGGDVLATAASASLVINTVGSSTFQPTNFASGSIQLSLFATGSQSLLANSTPNVYARGSGVKTFTSAITGTNFGSLILGDDNQSLGVGTTFRLGSNLTLASGRNLPTTTANSAVDTQNRMDVGIDVGSFTFDLTATSSVFTPTTTKAYGTGTTTYWTFSGSGGRIIANGFNLASTGSTSGVATSVGPGLMLESRAGNGVANSLSLGSGTGTLTIDPTSIFRYSGTAAVATPSTLVSTRSIGDIEVTSGALNVTGLAGMGAMRISSGGTLIATDTTGLPASPSSLTVASGAALIVGNAVPDATFATYSSAAGVAAGASVGFDTSGADRTYASSVSGSVGLVKTGGNTLTLSGSNNYSGGTVITGTGQLSTASATALGSGTITLQSTANSANIVLNLAQGMTLTNPVVLAQNGVNRNNIQAAGSTTLSGPITITGTGSGFNIIQSTGTLTIAGGVSGTNFGGSLSLRGGVIQVSSTVNMPATTLDLNTGGTTIVSSTGNVWAYTNFSSSATPNVLRLGADNALASGSMVMTGSAATVSSFDMNGYSQTLAGLSAGGTSGVRIINNAAGTSTLTLAALGANLSNSAAIVDGTGGGKVAVVMNSAGRVQTLASATSNYSGGTTILSGTLAQGAANALGSPGGALAVNGGTLDLGGFSLAVGALSGSAGGVITSGSAGAVTFTGSSASSSTFGGVILDGSGTVAFTKSGAGTLSLTGSNSFSGPVTLNGGVLSLGNANALGASGTIQFGGGTAANATLQYTTSNTTDFSSRIVSSTSAIGIDTNGQSVTFASSLAASNTAGLTKTGLGTLTLSASNAYIGTTTVNGGTLALGNLYALTTTTPTVVVNAGTLDLVGNALTLTSLSGTSAAGAITSSVAGALSLTATSSGNTTYAGGINNGSATISLVKIGTGTLTLSGSSDYTGGTQINAGALSVSNAGALGTSGSITFGGGTLQYAAGNAVDYSSRILGSGSTVRIDTNGQSVLFASQIASSNIGGFTKSGGGLLTLSGTGSYTGGQVTLDGGTTAISLGAGNSVSFGALKVATSNTTNANLSINSGSVTFAPPTGSYFAVADANTTASVGTVNVTGGSTAIDLSSANSRMMIGNKATGVMNVSGGSVTIAGGNAIYVGGDAQWAASNANGTFTISGGTVAISGAGSLILGNSGTAGNANTGVVGTLNLNGGELQTIRTITAGTSGTAANAQSSYVNFNGGVLKPLASSTSFMTGLTAAYVQNGGARIDTNGFDVTIGQALLTGTGSTGGLIKSGAGTLTLTGASTYTGATTVAGGTLAISGGANRLPSSSTLAFTGGTVAVTGAVQSNQTVASLTVSDSTSAAFVNTSSANATLTVTNAIALGGGSGTSTLLVQPTTAYNATVAASNGLTLNAGSELRLGAVITGANAFNGGGVSGPVTLNNGGSLTLAAMTGTAGGFVNSGAASVNWVGPLTMNGGRLFIDNSGTNANRRFSFNGNVAITGGTIAQAGTSLQGNLINLSGSAYGATTATVGNYTFNVSPASYDSSVGIAVWATGTTALTLGMASAQVPYELMYRNYGTNVLSSTAAGNSMGNLVICDNSNATASLGSTVKLGSNLNLISNGSLPVTSVGYSSTPEASGRQDLGIDANGFTFDMTANSNRWQLNSGTFSSAVSGTFAVQAYWQLSSSSGTGRFVANGFNFVFGTGSAGVANAYTGVGANVILESKSGNNIANDLGSSGTSGLTIDPSSTFRYSGTAAAASPSTLTAARSIGNLEVTGSGALRILSLAGGAQNLRVASGILDGGSNSISFAGSALISGGTVQTGTITAAGGYELQGGSVSAVLAGSAGLTKTLGGTASLTGTNTFSGATAISAGTLVLGNIAALQNTSGVSIADAAGLRYAGGAGTFDRNITVTGGTGSVTNLGGGLLTLAGTLSKNGTVLRLAGGSFNVTGQIVGANANSDLLVDGATVTLSNTNTYNGPTLVQNSGTLVLGVNDAIPSNSAVSLAGSTLTVGVYTDTIGSLSTSGNSTINVSINGGSSGGLSMGDLSFGGGTNTLALTMTSPTAGLYNLLTYSGNKTGSFTTTGVNPNYTVLTGAASNSSVALQRKADVGTVSASVANATIITGGSTAIGYTVANTTPTGGATLSFASTNGSNVSGASSGSALANSTSGTVSGLFFTGTAIGATQTGLFTVQDLAAITTTGTGSVSVTVLDHATPAFVGIDPALTNLVLNFGTVDQSAGLQQQSYSLTNIASIFGDSLTAGLALTGFAHDSGDTLFDTGLSNFVNLLASNTNSYTASFTPSTAGTFSETFRLSFSDNQSIAGAAQRRDLTVTMNVVVVPEPGALILAGIGVAAAAWGWSRRKTWA